MLYCTFSLCLRVCLALVLFEIKCMNAQKRMHEIICICAFVLCSPCFTSSPKYNNMDNSDVVSNTV